MNLKVGDTLTVNVLGREVTAAIANLREIDWSSLGINFALVLSPGTLDGAPQTFIATARTAPENDGALEAAVTDRFSNVSAISVRDVLAAVGRIVGAVSAALAATSAVTLAAGILVLAGAIAAGRQRRVYESVMLKVLGASQRRVLATFLVEYGLLGLASALLAGAIGTIAAYFVLTRVMHLAWNFHPLGVAATLAGAVDIGTVIRQFNDGLSLCSRLLIRSGDRAPPGRRAPARCRHSRRAASSALRRRGWRRRPADGNSRPNA